VRLTDRQYEAVRITHVRDGECVRTIQDGRSYLVADGTPIYVSSWAAVGGVDRGRNRRGLGPRGKAASPSPDATLLNLWSPFTR
jgi:hypothetical protein